MDDAYSFLRQERRFLAKDLGLDLANKAAIDNALEKAQMRIQEISANASELGIFRNAAMTLGCLAFSRENHPEALGYFLDVAYLDAQGATNSNSSYPCYNHKLAEILPFVVNLIRNEIKESGVEDEIVCQLFTSRWPRFAAFGTPPFTVEQLWPKLRKAISNRRY